MQFYFYRSWRDPVCIKVCKDSKDWVSCAGTLCKELTLKALTAGNIVLAVANCLSTVSDCPALLLSRSHCDKSAT